MSLKHPHPLFADLRFNNSIEDRFWKYVLPVTYDRGCWIWFGPINEKGYGRLNRGSRRNGEIKAHVLSWILHKGRVPEGKCVLHHCDNPSCVNPDHLWIGGRLENNRDSAQKGRNQRGEKHCFSKLTENDVRTIRSLWPSLSQSELARRFNVAWSCIWKIVHNTRWKHVV